MPYPFPEFETGRNLRLSPIYPKLRDSGAVFGQVMGYERPTWFETVGKHHSKGIRSELNQIFIIIQKNQRFETYTLLHLENQDGDPKPRPFNVAYTKTFGKPHWFDTVQREYWACRESVGLADYSSFTKIDLKVSSISGNKHYGY